jgi:threonyl-tRNA synthetase
VALRIELPDGSLHEYDDGTTGLDVARSIGPRLAEAAVAVRLDGRLLDLTRPLPGDGRLEVVTDSGEEGRSVLRHSVAHIMAQAVTDLYPDAKFAIGPPITDGFYYDFDVEQPFTPEDLERIEDRMHEIIRENQAFQRRELSRDEALELFADQPYKREIIERPPAARASGRRDRRRRPRRHHRHQRLRQRPPDGSVWPTCAAGRTSRPRSGCRRSSCSASRAPTGAATSSADAPAHLRHRLGVEEGPGRAPRAIEEARKRDHRKLGRELELVHFPDELGPGAVDLPAQGRHRPQGDGGLDPRRDAASGATSPSTRRTSPRKTCGTSPATSRTTPS